MCQIMCYEMRSNTDRDTNHKEPSVSWPSQTRRQEITVRCDKSYNRAHPVHHRRPPNSAWEIRKKQYTEIAKITKYMGHLGGAAG